MSLSYRYPFSLCNYLEVIKSGKLISFFFCKSLRWPRLLPMLKMIKYIYIKTCDMNEIAGGKKGGQIAINIRLEDYCLQRNIHAEVCSKSSSTCEEAFGVDLSP